MVGHSRSRSTPRAGDDIERAFQVEAVAVGADLGGGVGGDEAFDLYRTG